ncbi:methyltransferase [Clostridia bacterium]|nr:methyltransferase [Clostridia bacterium]
MSSRERLIKTLNHEQPDKLVVDMGATAITGIHASTLGYLRAALNLDSHPVKIIEPLQLLGEVEADLIEALEIDVVGVSNNMNMFGFSNTGQKPFKLQSGEDVVVPDLFHTTEDEKYVYLYAQGDLSVPPSARMPKGGFFFDNITRSDGNFDEENVNGKKDFAEDFSVFTEEQLRFFEKQTNDLYNNTELGLIGGGGVAGLGDFALIPGPHVKNPKGIRELTEFMIAHYTLPQYIHDIFGLQTEIALENLKQIKEAVGNKIQAMQISGADFGMQTGPYMSPDSYREFYKPYHKKINDWVHENTSWKTFYHTCGSIIEFLPDFKEAGIDILNPVQTTAAGMDPQTLKDKWGDSFVFWGGGVNTQHTLPFGTPEEVKQEVLERLRIFSVGGGFVFNTVHNIQAKTPIENLLAVFGAIREFDQIIDSHSM